MNIKITDIYDYLFYKIHRYWRRKKSRKDNAHIDAILTLSFSFISLFIIIFILPLVTLAKQNHITLDDFPEFKVVMMTLFVIYSIFNHFYFLSNNRFKDIFLKYVKESDEQKRKGNIYTIIFIIISLGTLPIFGFLYGSF